MGPCRICKEHKRLEYMIYDVICEIKQVHIAEEIMHKNSVQFSIRRTDPQRRRLSPSKKVPKVPILILTPVSQNPFDLNMNFYKFIMAERKSGPPKPRQ